MKKTFVLDTNVLLHDPSAMLRFEDNDVVLPITIIEELDRFKKQPEITGRNARQVSRMLDDLRSKGRLTEGISINEGGSLQVALCHRETLLELPPELEGDKADNAILAVSLELKRQCDTPVVLVSKDINLRIKADALGLTAEDYKTDKVDVDDLYVGMDIIVVSPEDIDRLFRFGGVTVEGDFFPNQG
ncbi:MAG: PIN domain-containing protein, partial [Phormidesmis sp. CAN_BIN44]|nr:PIN domain-containing protein [Phormidesmis sp. CAN_BIN44]